MHHSSASIALAASGLAVITACTPASDGEVDVLGQVVDRSEPPVDELGSSPDDGGAVVVASTPPASAGEGRMETYLPSELRADHPPWHLLPVDDWPTRPAAKDVACEPGARDIAAC